MEYDYIECGDCLELMKEIPDRSIDLILCDLPYGSTRNKWDSIISFNELWKHYTRIIKDNGCIALFCDGLFMADLMKSNTKFGITNKLKDAIAFVELHNKRGENIVKC